MNQRGAVYISGFFFGAESKTKPNKKDLRTKTNLAVLRTLS